MTKTKTDIKRSDYWRWVACDGLPREDHDRWTCESDQGYGPCGTYLDWGHGRCAMGHEIEDRREPGDVGGLG